MLGIVDKEQLLNFDRGSDNFKYSYETSKSAGPRYNEEFSDPDGNLDGTGDGTWESSYVEPKAEISPEGVVTREYLIVAFWDFNADLDTISMAREYTIDAPFAVKDNLRPLHISEHAECAFWFERSERDEVVIAEVSLREPAEPTKTNLRLATELGELLNDPMRTYSFSLTRINTSDGEQMLVYSKPSSKVSGGGGGLLKSQREAAAAIVKAQAD